METMSKCSGTQTVTPSRPPFYITPFTWKWPRYLFTWGVNLLVSAENKQQQEYTGCKDGSISTESDRAGEGHEGGGKGGDDCEGDRGKSSIP